MREIDLSRRNQLALYRQFNHLGDQAISMADAEHLFGINRETISSWAKKGFIRLMPHDGIQDRRMVMVNQQDVAYCAWVYHYVGGGVRGRRVFNPDGTPWQPVPQLPESPEARRRIGMLAVKAAKQSSDLRDLITIPGAQPEESGEPAKPKESEEDRG